MLMVSLFYIACVSILLLAELLRKPIERLQSYSLVLTVSQNDRYYHRLLIYMQDLCQHTPEAHNDFSVLKQSLNVMSDFIASTHDPRAFQQVEMCC